MSEEQRDSHPSYGQIGWSRFQAGGGVELYGSPMRHGEAISLKIFHSEKIRDLNRDWHHAKGQITEIWLSPAQFADFLTSPNQGDGIPCTIRSTEQDRSIELPDFEPQVEVFNRELKEDMEDIRKMAERLRTEVEPVLRNSKSRKADRDKAAQVAYKLSQEILDNLSYTHKSLGKAMQKTVTAAKSEVESFMIRRVHDAGLEHLKSDVTLPELLEGKKDDE